MTASTLRVFSGMQPTHNLHLGNYLGAMVNWIRMQDTHECIYCVVDLHAITLWQDPKELTAHIRDVTAAYLACGLDPKRTIIFNQSQVGRACRTRLGAQLRGPPGLAQPHDAVQGEGRQGQGGGLRRPL